MLRTNWAWHGHARAVGASSNFVGQYATLRSPIFLSVSSTICNSIELYFFVRGRSRREPSPASRGLVKIRTLSWWTTAQLASPHSSGRTRRMATLRRLRTFSRTRQWHSDPWGLIHGAQPANVEKNPNQHALGEGLIRKVCYSPPINPQWRQWSKAMNIAVLTPRRRSSANNRWFI